MVITIIIIEVENESKLKYERFGGDSLKEIFNKDLATCMTPRER